MRLIDADALIKDIAESLRFADEWEKESHEKKNKHGLKCAIDTRRSLLAMISRIKEAPTIDAEPVRHGRWEEIGGYEPENQGFACSVCDFATTDKSRFCPNCGSKNEGD